jgi:hypothetical protein
MGEVVSDSRVIVDYEELDRMAAVWRAAASTVARIGVGVAELAVAPEILADAIFDPAGAARAEAGILGAAVGPHSLTALAAELELDAVLLAAAVAKEQLVDDLPARQLWAVESWLVAAPAALAIDPVRAVHEGAARFASLANAMVGYASPHSVPLFELLAPSSRFRFDVLERRPVEVDPILGLPLARSVPASERDRGGISVSRYLPTWSGTPPTSMASMLDRVADLERQPSASMAIQRVTGTDGVRRYVVLLSGMRQFAPSPDPEDLLGAAAALVGTTTNYTRCVSQALDAAQVPRGAQVLLVGHSEGGLVAMDLAGDGAFSGARVRVTQVVAAGAPISSKMVVFGGGTRVLSIENVHDVVTHLDADDPPIGHQRADRLTYRFAIDEHDVVRSHDVRLYAQQAEVLADSPNPLMIGFQAGLQPYFAGSATTTVFTMRDRPAR